MRNLGQITMEQGFGQLLSGLASEAEVIVEFGTHDATGSTLCLYAGMSRSSQHLYTVDIDRDLQLKNADRFQPGVVTFIHGTIVKPEEFMPFEHPNPESRQYYEPERDANARAPYVLDRIPEKIDLLLLDGGEWTSYVEFMKLWDRCKVIALDDANAHKSNKNFRSFNELRANHWEIIGADPFGRNGWAVFRRPG